MEQNISALERWLTSGNKKVRLKALKLLLRHPAATPIQLVRCLCADDNRNFEFQEEFELGSAMRESWSRLRGVTDDEVYEYLASLYSAAPSRNVFHVAHVLELLCTPRALRQLKELRSSATSESRMVFDRAIEQICLQLDSGSN
jgi:hypothetical protein